MRTTITVDEHTFEQLMQLAGTDNKTEAVNLAIQEFIRRERLKKFRALRGKVEMNTNEELEAGELDEAQDLLAEEA